MPVSGTTLMTPPMMMNAWTPTIVVRPTASNFSNVRSVRKAVRSPAPTSSRYAISTVDGADQAHLLADGGEDEVVLRLGYLARVARGRGRCR